MIKERLGSLGSAGEGGVRGGELSMEAVSYQWGLSVIHRGYVTIQTCQIYRNIKYHSLCHRINRQG